MNLKFGKIIAVVLSLAMLLSILPAQALCASASAPKPVESISETYINPIYADELTAEDLNQPSISLLADPECCETLQAAGEAVRQQLKERQETVAVVLKISVADYPTDSDERKQIIRDIMEIAMAHTGVPTEGDYISKQYGGWRCSMNGYSQSGFYYLTYTYTMTYYTTAQQEAEMDTAVASLLSQLNLSGKSDYEKVKGVYDYICSNITYDYDHLYDDSYHLKHTAYAALIHKKAVCQGYSVLLYRLLLELGVDCRYISGTGNGGGHGWNIVKLDGKYYNVDATWDAGRSKYSYFLTCDANFGDHTRDSEFTTEAFYTAYPMSDTDYTPGTGATISGTVTSFGSNSDFVSVQLILRGQTQAAYSQNLRGNSVAYTFSNVAPGIYNMVVSKDNHVTRTGSVTVTSGGAIQKDVKIHLLGDVNGDGRVRSNDLTIVYAHISGTSKITDSYILACADVTGDGAIRSNDASRIYGHVGGSNPLW